MNKHHTPEDASPPATMTLAAHYEGIREAQEAAWQEGFEDGKRQDAEGDDGPRFVNPYTGQAA